MDIQLAGGFKATGVKILEFFLDQHLGPLKYPPSVCPSVCDKSSDTSHH